MAKRTVTEPRYSRGDAVEPRRAIETRRGTALTVTATEAKTRFGPLLESAIEGHAVVITKHDAPKAVLLSMAEYDALLHSRPSALNTLTDEFDTLLERMQSAPGKQALKAAFGATPAELGRSAVSNARRRR